MAAVRVVNRMGDFYEIISCREIFNAWKATVGLPDEVNPTGQIYPQCGPDPASSILGVIVHATDSPSDAGPAGPETAAASLRATFGMSLLLALIIHAIGVEIYLRLTPAEEERLRQISFERQVEAGMKHPGRAGLTADRFGDGSNWKPQSQE